MQSVIAIIIAELMYLLGVLGKRWPGWERGSFSLTEAGSSIRPMCRQSMLSNLYDGYNVVSLITYSVYCKSNEAARSDIYD